jgi:hypothetical protein
VALPPFGNLWHPQNHLRKIQHSIKKAVTEKVMLREGWEMRLHKLGPVVCFRMDLQASWRGRRELKQRFSSTVFQTHMFLFFIFGEESQIVSFKVRCVRFHINLWKWALKCCIPHIQVHTKIRTKRAELSYGRLHTRIDIYRQKEKQLSSFVWPQIPRMSWSRAVFRVTYGGWNHIKIHVTIDKKRNYRRLKEKDKDNMSLQVTCHRIAIPSQVCFIEWQLNVPVLNEECFYDSETAVTLHYSVCLIPSSRWIFCCEMRIFVKTLLCLISLQIQNQWVSGLCPSPGILTIKTHNFSETRLVSVLRWWERTHALSGQLETATPSHWLALCKGPNKRDTFLLTPEKGNRSNFGNVTLFLIL